MMSYILCSYYLTQLAVNYGECISARSIHSFKKLLKTDLFKIALNLQIV